MDRKMNNSSWCCEKIQELIEEYKNKAENLYGKVLMDDYKIAQ